MEYTYVCKACGHETRIEEKALLASGALICEKCLRRSGVSAAKREFKYRDDLLSPEQKRATYYRGGSRAVLVAGGAGTGKTRILAARARYLLKDVHISPKNIVILTSTHRGAKEIVRHIGCSKDYALRSIKKPSMQHFSRIDAPEILAVGTYYSFGLDLMKDFSTFYSNTTKVEPWDVHDVRDLKLIDREDQCAVLRKLRDELGLPKKMLTELVPEAEELRRIFTSISDDMIDVEEYCRLHPPKRPETADHLKTLAGLYTKYKVEHVEMDIDDILALAARALKETPLFHEAFSQQYYHVLADDIQDATPVQLAILKTVCPSSSLFCTGDDAQSMTPSGIRAVRDFGSVFPKGITLRLTGNHRSAPEIADAADSLLRGSGPEYNTDSTAHASAAVTEDTRHIPELHTFRTEQEEAEFVLDSVRGKLKAGVPPSEIMLLFRGADRAQVMEQTLREAGIPYRFPGCQDFLRKPHVKDVMSVIDFQEDARNESAWTRFLSLHPALKKNLSNLIRSMRKQWVEDYDMLDEEPMIVREWLANKVYPVYPNLSTFLYGHSMCWTQEDRVKEIIQYLTDAGLMRKKYKDWAERKKDLQMLIQLVGHEIFIRHLGFGAYEHEGRVFQEIKLDPDALVEEYDRDARKKVTLATVGGAKGLESDCCYLFHAQDGVFPPDKAAPPETIEDERRGLYVAMTRARKELIITQTSGETSIFLTQAMSQGKIRRAN